jgi:hypothetical protein
MQSGTGIEKLTVLPEPGDLLPESSRVHHQMMTQVLILLLFFITSLLVLFKIIITLFLSIIIDIELVIECNLSHI